MVPFETNWNKKLAMKKHVHFKPKVVVIAINHQMEVI